MNNSDLTVVNLCNFALSSFPSTQSISLAYKHITHFQTSQNTASGQSLQCLLTGFSIKNKTKMKKYTRHPKTGNELVQLVKMEESTGR